MADLLRAQGVDCRRGGKDHQAREESGEFTLKVELLYFDGCPSYEALLPRLRGLLEAAGADDALVLRRVESEAAAEAERFLGSPTVRVNGRDVDPGADERGDFGLKCRLYRTDAGLEHVPPDDWITAALEDVSRRAP